MVGITGDAYIVVEVDTQRSHEALRGVFFALVGKLLRTLAQIRVEDSLHTSLPGLAEFFGIALGNCGYIRLQHTEELVEVVQGVTIE